MFPSHFFYNFSLPNQIYPANAHINNLIENDLNRLNYFLMSQHMIQQNALRPSDQFRRPHEYQNIKIMSPQTILSVKEPVSSPQTITSQSTIEHSITLGSCVDNDSDIELKIRRMLCYFTENYGMTTEYDIQQEKQKYSHNNALTQIFDILTSKYSSIVKTREQRVKWIIRRALKINKQLVDGGAKVNSVKTIQMNTRCVEKIKEEEDLILKIKEDDFEDTLGLHLPFSMNSKKKTMNSSFLAELFKSEKFKQDYCIFLQDFDSIIARDSADKIIKFTWFIVDCIKKNRLNAIKGFNRIPWLKTWFQSTRKLAEELAEGKFGTRKSKLVKQEKAEAFS